MIKEFVDYINLKDKKQKFSPLLKSTGDRILTEYNGVTTEFDVEVIRCMTSLLDKEGDGRAFFLKEGETSFNRVQPSCSQGCPISPDEGASK